MTTNMTSSTPAYLQTDHPVAAEVEAELPRYARWCAKILFETHGQYYLPDSTISIFLRSCCRFVRREARLRGTVTALDLIKNRPFTAWWMVDQCRARYGVVGIEGEEQEEAGFDKFERERRAMWIESSPGCVPLAMREETARDYGLVLELCI